MKFTPHECFGCVSNSADCVKTKDFTKMPRHPLDLDDEFMEIRVVTCPDYQPRDNLEMAHAMKIQYQEGPDGEGIQGGTGQQLADQAPR